MNNTKLKLVPLGSSDVITTSGPVSGFLTLANFGNGILKDATLTGHFAGKDFYFSGNTESGALLNFLEGVYGDNYSNVEVYFNNTSFRFDGTKAFSDLTEAFGEELKRDDGYPYNTYDGTYAFDSLSNKFIKQLTE